MGKCLSTTSKIGLSMLQVYYHDHQTTWWDPMVLSFMKLASLKCLNEL